MRINHIQNTESWHAWRGQGIGAVDASAISGWSKWDTPISVYNRRINPQERIPQNQYQEWGTRLESVILDKFVEDQSITNVERGVCYQYDIPDNEWARCSLDGQGIHPVDGPIIIECKTGRNSSDWDPVPESYEAQVQWQMMVTGIPVAYFSVLITGVDWFWRRVEADPEMQRVMLERCNKFWYQNLLARVPPTDLTKPKLDYPALMSLNNVAEKDEVYDIDENTYLMYKAAKDNFDKAEALFDKAKAIMAQQMYGHKRLCLDGTTVAQYIERMGNETIDKKLLKELAPDIYAKVCKRGMPVQYIKYS